LSKWFLSLYEFSSPSKGKDWGRDVNSALSENKGPLFPHRVSNPIRGFRFIHQLLTINCIKNFQKGCYTAQWEHTILLRPTCKEVVSRGEDY